MAKCDEGYLCEVCGAEVEALTDSALYLQYVIGWIDPERLHTHRDCHLRCLPALAQFIVDDRFAAVISEGPLDKRQLDPDFVAKRTELVTRGYCRLHELETSRSGTTVVDYPLAEARARWEV